MKNVLIIFMTLTTFAISAQNKNSEKMDHHSNAKEKFTPEQNAELRTKQMTLELGLTESQQGKVKELLTEMNKNKPKRLQKSSEMTSEQRYAMKNAMLDRQIAFQSKMKDILTEEQMAKWEKRHMSSGNHFKQKKDFK